MKITRTQLSIMPFRLTRYLSDSGSSHVELAVDNNFSQVIAVFGPPGRDGAAGNRTTWSPPTASAYWMIPHNLGYKPAVEVRDSNDQVVFTNVTHLDINTCLIEFSLPVLGTAELV